MNKILRYSFVALMAMLFGNSYAAWEKATSIAVGDVIVIAVDNGTVTKELSGIKSGTTPIGEAVDYTGTPDGAMYGMLKDIQDLGSLSISSKTHIPNLLLTGQSITLHGMMGTMAGSLVTCSEVLTYEEIFNQLKKAN